MSTTATTTVVVPTETVTLDNNNNNKNDGQHSVASNRSTGSNGLFRRLRKKKNKNRKTNGNTTTTGSETGSVHSTASSQNTNGSSRRSGPKFLQRLRRGNNNHNKTATTTVYTDAGGASSVASSMNNSSQYYDALDELEDWSTSQNSQFYDNLTTTTTNGNNSNNSNASMTPPHQVLAAVSEDSHDSQNSASHNKDTTNGSPRGVVDLEQPSAKEQQPEHLATPSLLDGEATLELFHVGEVVEEEDTLEPQVVVTETMFGPVLPDRFYYYQADPSSSLLDDKENHKDKNATTAHSPDHHIHHDKTSGNHNTMTDPTVIVNHPHNPDDIVDDDLQHCDFLHRHHSGSADQDPSDYHDATLTMLDKHLEWDDEQDYLLAANLGKMNQLLAPDELKLLEATQVHDDDDENVWTAELLPRHSGLLLLSNDSDSDSDGNDLLHDKLALFDKLHEHDDDRDVQAEATLHEVWQKYGAPNRNVDEEERVARERAEQLEAHRIEAQRHELLKDLAGQFVVV
mmetsp:Transcript_29073/g.79794  ORF Transcript_29073/g.79794 Transcript_29073/m.79794 type:complete len:513 (-) Transcript_29073:460-1998(-)|eukprot:CAMPEP_0168750178 /NCGR_PEP_ID=MMETSP0724-20121128/17124_1 /TAXON_ID=265536 /ORGANISM="Amphiprora sp., Strain CCMP467" /LENGTH=512 /DNA_ID=CAMNT_0008798163 /DNA_START=229 /DNA_END=1767 /DNA_ORIENTATION=-